LKIKMAVPHSGTKKRSYPSPFSTEGGEKKVKKKK